MFDVDIQVPEQYPFQPLVMKFITKVRLGRHQLHFKAVPILLLEADHANSNAEQVYHPNISSASGAICLDILKPDAWSPVLTLKSTLVSLRSLLCSPEPTDPQDAEVAKHYLADRADWERTARYWTTTYADGSQSAKPPAQKTTAANALPGQGSGVRRGAELPSQQRQPQEEDPIEKAGLRREHVEQFVNMGFPQERVIEVMRRLNYRGAK